MLDLNEFDAVWRAEINPDKAAEALRFAAVYLRRREPLPDYLADWLADAFESAAAKPAKHRGKALAHELGLQAMNRRPKAHWYDVGSAVAWAMSKGHSQNTAAEYAANKFDVSEATAVSYLKKFRDNEAKLAAKRAAK